MLPRRIMTALSAARSVWSAPNSGAFPCPTQNLCAPPNTSCSSVAVLARCAAWPFLLCSTLLVVLPFDVSAGSALLSVEQLRCEYLTDPLGIDTTQPRLSWVLQSTQRAQKQTAYQILVASNEASLRGNHGDLWDSGKIRSDETLHVHYAGKPLAATQRCFWKVRAWDRDGKPSAWSTPAFWEMGLLAPGDWHAQWIARTTDTNSNPAPLLRRAFTLEGKIKQARAYICGLGYYELSINGHRIGDHLLDPGYTRYDKRILYATYDVTDALRSGKNAVGVVLGNGWYNVHTRAVWDFHKAPWRASPRLLMELQVQYADGRTETIATDGQWKTSTSPVIFDSIYGGQTYAARLEKPGWDTPDYNDSDWAPAQVVEAPKGKLAAQMMPPIKADQIAKPVKLTEPKPGVFVFDMGQNLAGFAELLLDTADQTRNTQASPLAPANIPLSQHSLLPTIILCYSERLAKNGRIDRAEIQQHVLRADPSQQFQTDTYILNPSSNFHLPSPASIPRFTYHGFQYVEVTGFPGKPTLDSLRGVFIHSAVPPAGEFECSNPLLNKIWRAARWSYLNNLQGIPTDCPHREKNGWTGDAHLAAEQALFNFAAAPVYAKWINDLGDEQQPSGELPGIVPTSGWGYKWGNGPAWDSAFLLLPFYLYQYCGDTQVLRDHYDGLKRYVDYLTTKAKDGIVNIGLNDWAPFETKTPADITSTAYYYRDAQIVSLAASLLAQEESHRDSQFKVQGSRFRVQGSASKGELSSASPALHDSTTPFPHFAADAEKYSTLAAGIKRSFNEKFYHPDTGLYANGSQTALSCALYQGLVEPENQNRVLSNLVAAVEKRHDHIDTGILGAKYILNALTENGRADVAYRIASRKDLPSWGWWIEQGATTLWEQWNGSESRNHIMFGDISAWFYKALAGINPDPTLFPQLSTLNAQLSAGARSGFKHFTIKPNLLGDLTWAKATYDSVRGRMASGWEMADGRFHLTITIPANTTATVYLPVSDPASVKEGDQPATKAEGVHFLRVEHGRTLFEVGSGIYRFASPLQQDMQSR